MALLRTSVVAAQPDLSAATRPPEPQRRSAEIHADRTVTVRFHEPGTEQLTLDGARLTEHHNLPQK